MILYYKICGKFKQALIFNHNAKLKHEPHSDVTMGLKQCHY